MGAWSYILQLEDDCYYCGATKFYNKRIKQHFEHDGGAKWCFMHKPIKVIYKKQFSTYKCAFQDECANVIQLMGDPKIGIRKVRGADAVNTRPDCYTPNSLRFWIPKCIREDAINGRLGKVDIMPTV